MQLRPILAREVRVLTMGTLILMFLFIAPIRALRSYATSWMSQLFGPAVTFSVTNTNDSGAGSLRQAISDANNSPGSDTIGFNIPGSPPFSIPLVSPLPTIADAMIIDGTTQPGFSGVPIIELNGSGAGVGADGLFISAGSTTIKALVINRFNGNGIVISIKGGNSVQGCYVGTSANGSVAQGNSGSGIRLVDSDSNTIGGIATSARNLISGNFDYGIKIVSGSGNNVQGNFIGTNVSGSLALSNQLGGIYLASPNNTIGGTVAGARNIISGNFTTGVFLFGSSASGNSILGNYIGTDVNGTAFLGNYYGVYVQDAPSNFIGGKTAGARNVISSNQILGVVLNGSLASGNSVQGNYIGTNASGTGSLGNGSGGIEIAGPGNTVGGTDPTARNLISGNFNYGVLISGNSSTGNSIQGNFIGTDVNGTADLGNSSYGVLIGDAPNNTIGGTTADARNIISGNNSSGVYLSGSSATGNSIQGNYIGTNATGTGVLGNSGHGVEIQFASNNQIGGVGAGAGNLISNNGQAGVDVVFGGSGNSIRANSISSNGGLGIDLGNNGVTPNDASDSDSGPNDLQNFPVLTSVTNAGGTTTISGSLNSAPLSGYAIDFYSSTTVDDSLYGEGQVLLGSTIVTTDAGGNANFNFNVSPQIPIGTYISSTATGTSGLSTSEFSRCAVVGNIGPMAVTNVNNSGPGSLRQAIIDADLHPGPDTVTFNIPGAGPFSIALLSTLPVIDEPIVIDATTQPGFSGLPIVELNGSNAGSSGVSGLTITGGGSTIKGLVINRFNSGNGIRLLGAGGNMIQGNFLGTNLTGVSAAGNGVGIRVENSDNVIGGTTAGARNLISANSSGVYVIGSSMSGNTIQGNYVGTDVSGTADLGNFYGIFIDSAANNIIGGTSAGARNLISGNDQYGVFIGGTSSGNLIKGNYIGTNVSGTVALGNSSGIGISASGNTVGGTDSTARNLISGNNNYGVFISGSSASGNSIQGNFIGTDSSGTADLGNFVYGVWINDAPNNAIGGTTTGARNIISGNNSSGVNVSGFNASGNLIQGNYIGTNAVGTGAIGNSGHGVQIQSASNNTIGGDVAGSGNVISNNGQAGVAILSSGNGNSIRGNSIFSNGGLGIDLDGNGVTPNDAGDTDSGPNNYQNFPIITSIVPAGANTAIVGTINSAPTTSYALEFFSSTAPDDSLNGEGQVFLGSTSVMTDVGGNASFNFIVSPALPSSVYVSATATRNSSPFDTSEFSRVAVSNSVAPMPVSNLNNSGPGSLRQAIIDSNLHPGVDSITFNIPGSAPFTIAPLTALPSIDDPVIVDATTQPGYAGTPIVELNGTNVIATGLTITAGNSTIKGFVINRFGSGIVVSTNGNNLIQGNFIGTDVGGTLNRANTQNGIFINGSPNNLIGGLASGARNLISGNFLSGVSIVGSGANGNSILGNLIGTDINGLARLGNSGNGVTISNGSSNNVIGAANLLARNIISGNNTSGISINAGSGNIIQGNFIGTDINGVADLGNFSFGIGIFSSSGNTIGGTTAGTSNVISGNDSSGISIQSGSGNNILGNFIGTDVNGARKVGNSGNGILFNNTSFNSIGLGTPMANSMTDASAVDTAGKSHDPEADAAVSPPIIISGNNATGILISGGSNNLIQGCIIGTDINRVANLGNSSNGIDISSSNTTVGGIESGAANSIGFNGGSGVLIRSGIGNSLVRNSIRFNVGLGIDLGIDGVTANDQGDSDAGANNKQNFPVIDQVVSSAGSTTISGTINSNGDTGLTLEFFWSEAPDASGFGEGGTYIGSKSVVTDSLGNATYTLSVPELPTGVFVSATATRTTAPFDTSEFSRCVLTGDLSPIQVINTETTGPGSLAQAIINANFHPGPDTITFNIVGNPPFTILGALPSSTGPITIDATTQPGYSGAPLVEIRRSGSAATDGLVLAAGSSTVKGLVFNNFLGAGLVLQSAGNTVQGNYLGTTQTGTAALGNAVGIRVESTGNLIGGGADARNVISGNTDSGVLLFGTGASGNTIQGNFIGTDVTGTVDLGNVINGIKINGGQNNLIGGTTASTGNLISGNNNTGVLVLGFSATGNVIQGNLIGTNAAGIGALGNSLNGVEINGASNNSIGGTANGSRNIISANGRVGVSIFGISATGNQVLGNYVGTDVNGTADLGNSLYGVEINGAPNNQIGGNTSAAANVISGNNSAGIQIFGVFSTGNVVIGNFIGTDKDASAPLPNSSQGVLITAGASINTIGGIAPGQANVIAFNNGAGIAVSSDGTGNMFRGNSCFSNGALGIDLGIDGVTPNDAGDADIGANNLQNYPVLASATSNGSGTAIQGNLNSTPSSAFTIDFYRSINADPTGYGEGQIYLYSTTVNTNGSGVGFFNVSFGTSVPLGNVVTALATNDSTGDSSELSQAQTVTAPTAITLASFIATGYDDGVFIEWRTGLEVDNLGFNIYRDESGKRTLVNHQLVAGSALRDGFAIAAGEAYAWWDSTSSKNAVYWLEDVDLKGASLWHGPFVPTHEGGAPPPRSNAALISKIGNQTSDEDPTRVVESVPSVSARSADQVRTQSSLTSETAVKIAVKQEGWYRVTQPELVAAGLNPKLDSRLLQLFVEGRELPIYVAAGKDGSFDESSTIEFYGVGLDTPSTNSRIYWLITGDKDGKRIPQTKAAGAPSSAQSFTRTVERRDRTIYFSALLNGEKENFFGSVIVGTGVEQLLTLNHFAPADVSNLEAALEVTLQGVTITGHRVLVQLNGVTVGEISFSGHQQGVSDFKISQSVLREGGNTVRLIPQGGASDISLVDRIRISYQHSFTADDNSLKLESTGGEQIAIDGFTQSGIRVFDVTDTDDVKELIGEVTKSERGFLVSVTPQDRGLRTLIAVTDDKSRRPASVAANKPTTLRSPGNVADLVIITTGEIIAAIEPLKAARQSEGYRVAVVDVEDIYDEFTFGHKSPQAIKDFLAFAVTNWKVAPRFVLLAGDASFDANNYLGLGDNDLVPTRLIDTAYMETASDDWFADFNNDAVSDLAIGRLPFRTYEEAVAVVSKLIAYSRSKSYNSVALVSDANDGFDFEKASAQLVPLFPASLRVEEIRRGGRDPFTARAQLLDSIGRGDKLINYIGHGSANQWRDGLLTSADAAALRNEDRLPMFVMMSCLNGYFHDAAFDSLAEALVKAGHGGAVAAWASSGMTTPDQHTVINQQLYRLLFAASFGKATIAPTIGEATQRAKTAVGDADVRRTWILLGDPTMRLR